MSENKRLRLYAVFGVIGGVVFQIGDCLLYIYPGLGHADIEPLWAEMPEWRFTVSAILGFLGMGLMLFGFWSLYQMTVKTCGAKMRRFMMLGGVGVATVGFLHFALGSLVPLTYQYAIDAGVSPDAAANIALRWSVWLTPVNVVMLGLLYIQMIVLFYMLLSGRAGLPKWFVLVSPVGAVLLGVLWLLIFRGTVIEGAWGACESLGEGLMYLVTYLYWRGERKDGSARKCL